ncbi:MAG: hypothetical protein ACYS4W_07095 [Planctomycetota bacterium]
MKKVFFGLLIVALIVAAVIYLQRRPEPYQLVEFPEPPLGAVVFDMKYRGLGGPQEEIHYNAFWGFGGSDEKKTRFLKALEKRLKQLHPVYNPEFKGAEWSAVELKDNDAVAFYFDLNANGRVSDNERIAPCEKSESDGTKYVEFVTPDFIMKEDPGRHVPFRVLLQVSFEKSSDRPNCMWSPSCILEGTSEIDGQPETLILFSNGFSGSFDEFRRSTFSLHSSPRQPGSYVPRHPLSSLINHRGRFYQLKLYGGSEKGKTIRVVLEKDTTCTGQLSVSLISDTNLKSSLDYGKITTDRDPSIYFSVGGRQCKMPAAAYKLDSGQLSYGTKDDYDWRLRFREGPQIKIDPASPRLVQLGAPGLSVHAIDEKNRYKQDAREQSVFSKGTKIHLSRKITGRTAELFGRFSQKDHDSNKWNDIKPVIRIVDSDGKEVLSAKMEYG